MQNLTFSFINEQPDSSCQVNCRTADELRAELGSFNQFGKSTQVKSTQVQLCSGVRIEVETYVNEFWTARQRAAHSLHEISYRACFKPQLPRFFIERLTRPGDTVYDPFMGRGTTLLEAALLGRVPVGCDVNPISTILLKPRLDPPAIEQVARRLAEIDFNTERAMPEELLVFYHPRTLQAIIALREHISQRRAEGTIDPVDEWICMVAVNRLTGHSPGFFSVYTLPPNQAASVQSQRKINEARKQVPPLRDVALMILRKSKKLLRDCDLRTCRMLSDCGRRSLLLTSTAASTPLIPSETIDMVVTSPPFLNIVNYAKDNWLRCWFAGIDPRTVQITMSAKLESWRLAMTEVFHEIHRVLKPGGYLAFEVGEIRGASIRLEQEVIPCGAAAGLDPVLVLINDQRFTKTANCWGVDNNAKGTNSNRIVLFQRNPARPAR
jgi:hypothetical protein